jgi:hypothetical protein
MEYKESSPRKYLLGTGTHKPAILFLQQACQVNAQHHLRQQ